jgi:hypothetical protein
MKRIVVVVVTAALSLLCLPCLTTRAQSADSGLRLVGQGPETCLIKGKSRFPISLLAPGRIGERELGPRQVQLPNGYVVSFPPNETVEVRKKGRLVGVVSLHDYMEQLLEDDSFWQGHKQANDVRYLFRGPRKACLGSPYASGNAVLGIFTAQSGSGDDRFQILVRILPGAEPKVQVLRQLISGNWFHFRGPYPVPRLFKWGSRFLLLVLSGEARFGQIYDQPGYSALHELDGKGKDARKVATFPGNLEPAGVLGNRWVILAPAPGVPAPVQVLDLTKNKRFSLPGTWLEMDQLVVPPQGDLILSAQRASQGESTLYVIRIPDGRRTPIVTLRDTLPIGRIWDNLVVVRTSETSICVYRASTGKLVQQFTVPPRTWQD